VSLDISFHEAARTEFDEATDFYGMERVCRCARCCSTALNASRRLR